MKVLVATKTGQGRRHTDVFRATEGEMVVLELCSDSCGPRLATFRGVESGQPTTTAMVEDRPEMKVADFLRLIERDHAKHLEVGDLSDQEKFHCILIRESIVLQCSVNELIPGDVIRRKGLEITAMASARRAAYRSSMESSGKMS